MRGWAAARPNLPEPVIVPHESALVGMAHGYWLATGRPQAAMVHVNVGLAIAAMAMINARADDVPVLLMSGRTPLTEHDRPGARRTPIQYGQEQFDQASLVRDVVKWHFELRYPETVPALLSRALAVAKSAPEGPVYLSLPREPLTELTGADVAADPLQAPSRAGAAAAEDIATAAGWLAAAENPLIICQRGDPGGRVAAVLEHLAEAHDLPVAEVFATRKVFRGTHPMAVGPDLSQRLPEADVVLVVDAPVAWIEHHNRPPRLGQGDPCRAGPAACADADAVVSHHAGAGGRYRRHAGGAGCGARDRAGQGAGQRGHRGGPRGLSGPRGRGGPGRIDRHRQQGVRGRMCPPAFWAKPGLWCRSGARRRRFIPSLAPTGSLATRPPAGWAGAARRPWACSLRIATGWWSAWWATGRISLPIRWSATRSPRPMRCRC